MHTSIFVTLQLEGLHRWPLANEIQPEVGFLSNVHRHMFHFYLEKLVYHDDRDIEFIMFKRDVTSYLLKTYMNSNGVLDFDSKSCEMIAIDLLNKFKCTIVSVSEDGENGAKITAI